MSDGSTLRRLALALDSVSAAPHFGRIAFKARRIFVTLAADRLTANFRFSPDEQALKCTVLPDAFSPLPNAWGQQGWTLGVLSKLSEDDLANAIETAWRHAQAAPPKKASRKRS